ncbi:MAG: hypothetical protein ABSG67_06655 [Thermoguttaceae bacterium]|jgi:uncharacterized spore protein YtfJ
MKKFALFAMIICASFMSFGCAEKKAEKKATPPAAEQPAGGGTEKPAEEKPAQ